MSKTRGIDLRWNSILTHEGVKPRVFAWIARTGIGVRAGSRSIDWTYSHNMAAIESITAASKKLGGDLTHVFVRNGRVYAGRTNLGSVRDFFNAADVMCRARAL